MKLLKLYIWPITVIVGCLIGCSTDNTRIVYREEPTNTTAEDKNRITQQTQIPSSDSTKERYFYQQAMAFYDSGNYLDAEIYYTKALEIKEDAIIYYSRGKTRYQLKKYRQAIEDFDRALSLNPNYAVVYLNRGIIYDREQQWEFAIADYTQAIQLNPNYANAYYNRALLYHYDLQNLELALADYNKAIDLNPNYADAYKNRGLLEKSLGEEDKARASWLKASAIYQRRGRERDYQDIVNLLNSL